MKPVTKFLLFLITIATVIGVVRIMGTNQSLSQPAENVAQSSFEAKESEGGNVTVSVTPVVLKTGFPASFDIAFETHSVDLAFDVEQIATLTDETGIAYTPHWDGSPAGGHHRSGILRFTPDLSASSTLTLKLKDIAGIPTRTFTWEATQ